MKLPTVKNFLCCLTLETGGLVIGWLAVIGGALASFALVAGIIFAVIALVYADDINTTNNINDIELTNEDLKALMIILIVVYAIALVFCVITFIAAIQLIRGTKNRNHQQCKFYMVLMGVGTVLSFLQIFTSGVNGIAGAIIGAAISAYFFVCIYSMYEMFKKEKIQNPGQGQAFYGQGQPQPYFGQQQAQPNYA